MRGAKSAKMVASAIVVALAATACGGGSGESSDSKGFDPDGIVTVRSGEPQNPLQPANAKESNASAVLSTLFQQLTDYDEDGNIVYVNADSIETSDSKMWTVKLKDGWTFHNGEKVTAQSYVDAWNYGANIEHGQTNSSWFSDIVGYDEVHPEKGKPTADKMKGLKVVDDLTFTIELGSTLPYYEYKLAYDPFAPLPKAFFDDPEAFGQKPVGNGPYKFDSWKHNKSVKVVRYDDYKGEDKAENGGITFKNYDSLEGAYQDLLSGNLDVTDGIAPKDLPKYESDLGDRAVSQPMAAIQTLVPVFYQEQWKDIDPKVLQGLSMAIDRDTITKTVLNDTRIPASSFVPPGVKGYQKDVLGEAAKYDPKRAKELIKEGGGVPKNKISVQYNADGGHKEWIDAMCNSIRQATGVECVGDSKPDFATDLELRDKKQVKSMYRGGWVLDYPMNANFLRDLYGTGAAGNTGFYSNEKFDDLAADAEKTTSLEESVKLYQEAEKALAEDLPAIPLWYYRANGGYSKQVDNVKFAQDGDPIFHSIKVKK
ncbi:hypothetical protein N566_03950 [Streptomycetaceae bacterium MP113-05]|nr:hypothetical protein N566_03950 [Streptomycetaceae bacterium MP113-05]